jgi:DNA-binding NtrC family response regulator
MMFGQAAERCGWRQAIANDQTTALAHLASGKVGLVLIDTAMPGEHSVAERHLLIELLSGQKNLLTVVCGRTDDQQEEVWARQCGAWMYLPGVAPESDLDPILSGAKELVERRQRRTTAVADGFEESEI